MSEQERNEEETKVSEAVDHSVFDFNDSDSDGSLEIVCPAAAATVEEDVPEIRKIDEFRQYTEQAKVDYRRLSPKMSSATELMDLMNRKGGNTVLYNAVFEWHVKHIGCTKKMTDACLHQELVERYNLEDTKPFEVPTKLPSSNDTVNLACHDYLAQVTDLLTDPRHSDDDYLFFDDDPLQDPPKEWETLADVNTGLSFRDTHAALIAPAPYTDTGRKKTLLTHIGYLDACVTGQFQNLSIEIFKFTLGIFTAKCREKDSCWRNLGYVHSELKGKKTAEEFVRESSHVDSQKYLLDPNFFRQVAAESEVGTPSFDGSIYGHHANENNLPVKKAQDLHKMLQVMLSSYKKVEMMGGFPWDLHYRGTTHRLWMVPVFLFVKGDGVEHDKLCGHYVPKNRGIENICRYCCIASNECDQPYLDPPPHMKTMKLIADCVKQGDNYTLQKLSQHAIWNCFYELRFGLHNGANIHGACPMEILHWILLGMYKYSRENFFSQTGVESILSENLNAVAVSIGILLKRQSDRDMPRTKYRNGIKHGQIMAQEMTGLILVLLTVLRSSKGRNLIMRTKHGNQKTFFPNEQSIQDWITLLEMQLKFEAWLNKDEMKVKNVKRAETKVKELDEHDMTKQVAKGVGNAMGFKTMNFHVAIVAIVIVIVSLEVFFCLSCYQW